MSAFGGKADKGKFGLVQREVTMPTYLMLVNFTDQGVRGLKRSRAGKINLAKQQRNLELNENRSG